MLSVLSVYAILSKLKCLCDLFLILVAVERGFQRRKRKDGGKRNRFWSITSMMLKHETNFEFNS